MHDVPFYFDFEISYLKSIQEKYSKLIAYTISFTNICLTGVTVSDSVYNLRPRNHNRSLITKTTCLNQQDFLIRMLYKTAIDKTFTMFWQYCWHLCFIILFPITTFMFVFFYCTSCVCQLIKDTIDWLIVITKRRRQLYKSMTHNRRSPVENVPAVKKFKILKIQDGGGRHLEKSENSHILAAVRPILTKFGTVTHNSE